VIRLFAVATLAVLVFTPAAYSSCMETTPAKQSDIAEVVFEGIALGGPAVDGVLVSPARFRVTRYLKGGGPDTRLVETALRRSASGSVGHLSVGILPGEGEHLRIFGGDTRAGVVSTGICSGSGPIGSTSAAPFVPDEDSNDFLRYGTAGALAALLVGAGLLLLRRHRHVRRA
jgi:hypothetical protein